MQSKGGRDSRGSASAHHHEDVQLLTFRLDNQEYGLDITNVVQVVRMVAITRSPKAPEFVEGMINLRGRVIPVINLRKRLSLVPQPIDVNNHLLIAQSEDRVMALVVDVVSEMLTMPHQNLDVSQQDDTDRSEFVWAVGKIGERLVLILDLAKVLQFAQIDERRLERSLIDVGATSVASN